MFLTLDPDPLHIHSALPDTLKIGIIGRGFVGGALFDYFNERLSAHLVSYDKHKHIGSMAEVSAAQVIFVAVPTPAAGSDKGLDTSILQEVLEAIPQNGSRIVVIKSTVPVGFTRKAQHYFSGLRLVFAPEFLTEANALKDVRECNRLLLGVSTMNVQAAQEVARVFYAADPTRWETRASIAHVLDFEEAELTKLMGNAFLMTKVLFANEVYALCEKLALDYETVRQMVGLDPRIGPSHLRVPGPDGKMGAGGACFPKDMGCLVAHFQAAGVPQRLLSAVIERNAEVRK